MTFETIIPASQMALFAFEGEEEAALPVNSEMPEAEAKELKETSSKVPLKDYRSINRPEIALTKKVKEFVDSFSSANFIFSKGDTNKTLPRPPFFESLSKESQKIISFPRGSTPREKISTGVGKERPFVSKEAPLKSATSAPTQGRSETKKANERQTARETYGLKVHKWTHEETVNFWDTRYYKREEEKEKRDQRHPQEEQEEKNEKVKKIEKKTSLAQGSSSNFVPTKPVLERPKMGVFALYFILTKLGILSDGASNYAYKKEIELIDADTTKAHQSRLDEMKKALDKENETKRWGIAQKVFSWIGALFGIIGGIVLIATGVGAVAGAMMIAAGVIQITSQILEITGGWNKIAELLPGESLEKKRAVISWIQIGIAVLCLILAGAGAIWGGFGQVGEAMSTASNCIGAIAEMGQGVTAIGQGRSDYMYYDRMSAAKFFEKVLAELRHRREDLMDKVDWGVDRLQQLFEDLARALEFEVEIFRADQMVNRG